MIKDKKTRRVLLFEPCPWHYEIIPGFAYYFVQLGYEVDCLLQDSGDYGNMFCRCPDLRKKIHVYRYEVDTAIAKTREMKQKKGYDLLFFTTIDMTNDLFRKALVPLHSLFEKDQGIFGCCHLLPQEDEDYRTVMLYFKNRMVTLSKTEIREGELFEVNPNYFSDEAHAGRIHDPVSIISVGISTNRNELQTAADRLYRKTGETAGLVFVGLKDSVWDKLIHLAKYLTIKVLRLQKYDISHHRPVGILNRHVKEKIFFSGKVPFSDLFKKIEGADFIALNFYDKMAEEFSSCRTSGGKQLSLGFLKPCIIERETADYYGFTEENAVIYEEGQLEQALHRVSQMTGREYDDMVKKLQEMCCEVRKRSLLNLDRMIHES